MSLAAIRLRSRRARRLRLGLLALLGLGLALLTLSIGQSVTPLPRVVAALTGAEQDFTVSVLRLPRAVLGVLAVAIPTAIARGSATASVTMHRHDGGHPRRTGETLEHDPDGALPSPERPPRVDP